MEPKENYYFTFMQKNEPKNKYVRIFDTYAQARRKMCEAFGDQWALQYNEKEFLPHMDRFGLVEIPLEEE